MRFKKLFALGLSLVVLVSSAACGKSAPDRGPAGGQETTEAPADSTGAAAVAAAAQDAASEEGTAEAAAADFSGAASYADEEISPDDISVTWDDSHVYSDLTLGRFYTITTYGVKGYEDVPFISATQYLDILFEGKQKTFLEDNVMKVALNGTEAVIDPKSDTILFENPSRLRSAGDIDGALIEENEYNIITKSVKNKSVQTEIQPVTVSLKDYHMPVIPYEDDILMPFLALQNTFGSVIQCNFLAYNGKDYYNAFSAEMYILDGNRTEAKDSPYMKAIKSGPFREKSETTQAYADYGYYSICLLLDLTFGHKEEKNITTFDEYFTRMNAKESMCSTKPYFALTAEFMLFNYLFDTAHDTVFSIDTVFDDSNPPTQSDVEGIVDDIKESDSGREFFNESNEVVNNQDEIPVDIIIGALLEKGLTIPEVLRLCAWDIFFTLIRPEEYNNQRLDYAGDTAVIFFRSFLDDSEERNPSYYLEPLTEEDEATSNFAFFYNCFEDIKQHDEVKNVVINIADNGGGNAAGLISILGFLSEDGEVKITDKDMLAGNYREECYHIDTNLDGIADDQDGFGGQYDFYIMTSGGSYSCANALPYFAQQDGLATIIGSKPGGGDCVLSYFIDAYGNCAVYSGKLKLGKDDGNGFVSNEKATEIDLDMMPSIFNITSVSWYDPEGISDAVHQYQEGKTEILYSDEQSGEDLSEFLNKLFGRIQENKEESGSAAEASTEVSAE